MRLRRTRDRSNTADHACTVFAVESAVIRSASPEGVSRFMRPAELELLTQDGLLRAFTVPGTGPGKGEHRVATGTESITGSPDTFRGRDRGGRSGARRRRDVRRPHAWAAGRVRLEADRRPGHSVLPASRGR